MEVLNWLRSDEVFGHFTVFLLGGALMAVCIWLGLVVWQAFDEEDE